MKFLLTKPVSCYNLCYIRIILKESGEKGTMSDKAKERGFKRTPQRLAILRYLEGNTGHPSAEEIYRAVRRRFPTMSLATVYNTLETLRDRGELLELSIDPRRRRYDPGTHEHDHVICTFCGRVADIPERCRVEVPRGQPEGFVITGSHVQFRGLCPDCRKRKEV